MTSTELVVGLGLAVLVGVVVCLEVGYLLGRREARSDPELAHEGIGVLEAALFALLGLLLALAFSGGLSRLDARRLLVVQEANAIGTAYLRLDLLPPDVQPEMRQLFRQYLDARLRVYQSLSSPTAMDEQLAQVALLQREIWSRAVTAAQADPTQNLARLLLPALNEMIDVTTARTIALHTHLPGLIFALLIGLTLVSGLVGGYAIAKRQRRSWLHILVYAVVMAVTIFVVMDLDYPRVGLIQLGSADKALLELRNSIR
jgi:hypothetical protein